MSWIKRGRIFDPAKHPEFAFTHAQVPTVLVLGDVLRIFYADRDRYGKSFISYLDVSAANPGNVLYYHRSPLMSLGKPGTFDDDGMMPSYALPVGGRVYLYYSGWNRGTTVPYRNSIGIAVSDDGARTFHRMFEGPIMDRTPEEPYIAVTPSILLDGEGWRMWYISGVRWAEIDGAYEPVYVIKYAYSDDGIHWVRPNHVCLEPRHDLEAYSRPSVLRTEDGYRMWYCARDSRDYRDGAGSYRIGYAESKDGLNWSRRDEFGGLPVSAGEWDATMTCYPYAVNVEGKTLLFYNGNGFGRSGFGYALWSETENM